MSKEDFQKQAEEDINFQIETYEGNMSGLEGLLEQLHCQHEMVEAERGGRFGGFDIDTCVKCGYEFCY